jgi:NAD(P)-dependent dehydrogenase (short-subunit alcohol dehydrogenase family)
MAKTAKMENRICMVTGANSGIGKETALQLARLKATVVMVCRNRERGMKAQQEIIAASGNNKVDLLIADLSSLEQIKSLVKEFKAKYKALHVLVNNAGVMNYERRENEEGIEATFATNHLGYFRLTNLLLDVIKKSTPARIINVSSDAHRFGAGNFDAVKRKDGYRSFRTYGLSKFANILFTRELAKRLAGTGVTVNALHPGFVRSNFGSSDSKSAMNGLFKFAAGLMAITPEQGAETSVYLAVSDEVKEVTGGYFSKKKAVTPHKLAFDEKLASDLWEMSLAYGL